MALEELKAEIEHEARMEAARIEKESEAESGRIILEAKTKAEGISRSAGEALAEKIRQRRSDCAAALDEERNMIIADAARKAVDSSMEGFLQLVREKLEAAEQEIIKSALERFGQVVPLKRTVAKLDKRNEKMAEGVGRIEQSKVRGIMLSSMDGSITADATVESLLESNADAARRALYRGMVD